MSVFDVVCVGNAKIDSFLSIQDANSHIRLNPKTGELCVKSGEKITVDSCSFLLGGNACNVGVGLSRLKINTALMAELGDDEFSQKIINLLSKENVNTKFIQKTKNKASSFSTIINFKGERTIFSEHVEREHGFNLDNLSAKWIYLTSLGNKWIDAYQRVTNFAKNNNTRLAFNPGSLQLNDGVEKIKNVLKITSILFVNKEEGQRLTSSTDDIKKILRDIKKLGPQIVALTDGKNGSYSIDQEGNILNNPIIKVKSIEKTGAGDAYASGFLAALISQEDIKTAMLWGTNNSASVIQKIGAQPGLLTKERIAI